MATVPLTLLEVQRLASVVSIPITRSCLNHSRSAISVPLPFHACLDQEKSAAIYKQAEALQSVAGQVREAASAVSGLTTSTLEYCRQLIPRLQSGCA